jgi:hypothetical protein
MLIRNMNLFISKLIINTIINQDYLILPHIDGLLLSLSFSDQYLQFSFMICLREQAYHSYPFSFQIPGPGTVASTNKHFDNN